jgi:hypothetical protein
MTGAFDYLPSDEPLDEAPLFYIEPRDRDPRSEHDRQSETVRRLRALGFLVTAIPNARAWGGKAWNRAKAEGVEWGAADLIVGATSGRMACIEMKNGREMPEDHQVRWLNARHRLGFPVAVCRTADAAIRWLATQGFDVEARDAA